MKKTITQPENNNNEEAMTDIEQLAKRTVSCEGFRWMVGMLCLTDEDGYAARILHVGLKASTSETADSYNGGGIITRGCIREDSLPDLDDPATIGCLLTLVRVAWHDPNACVMRPDLAWRVQGDIRSPVITGKTEAEALVAALEAVE